MAELVLVFARQSPADETDEAEDEAKEERNGSSEGAGAGRGRTGPLQRTMSPSVKSVRMACWKSFLTAAAVGTWLAPEANVELGAAGALPLPLEGFGTTIGDTRHPEGPPVIVLRRG